MSSAAKRQEKILLVHPGSLGHYSAVFLRLEPLGLELIAAACRKSGYSVRLLDLQASSQQDYFRWMDEWRPDAVGFSLNYLANIPEVVDLAKQTRQRWPECFVFVGGHSASFTAWEILEHAAGAIDCVVHGEGEEVTPKLVAMAMDDRKRIHTLPGVVSLAGEGPAPELIHSLDDLNPARDLLAKRKKYFIGILDPAASVEFTRGCPWDCVFCSAWTFYGRSYRKRSAEVAAEDLATIREPGVFIVDDVAFVHPEHGFAIGREIERRGVKKQYYLETRSDVLLRNREVFRYWKRLGLEYIFLGFEAIDEEGLQLFRKRVHLGQNFEALQCARDLGITVALNIIADPNWDEKRFAAVREWALSVPEIVNLSVSTPYPGTETWMTESRQFSTRDYRLFDVQHAVMPTKLTLKEFYTQLVQTQKVLNKKHLGWAGLRDTFVIAAKLLAEGQTNFVKMLWKFNKAYNINRQLSDHRREVKYQMSLPKAAPAKQVDPATLYIHPQQLLKPIGAGHPA
jgi:hopanoid C-3 methylase